MILFLTLWGLYINKEEKNTCKRKITKNFFIKHKGFLLEKSVLKFLKTL